MAALVTEALPEGISTFGVMDDVWVMRLDIAIPVAIALRDFLLRVALVRQAAEGGEEKAKALYGYLTGPACHQKIKAIVDAFLRMQDDLNQEMKVMTKHLAQRGMEISQVMKSVSSLCGDLQGIAGSQFLRIDALEMKALDAPEDITATAGSSNTPEEDA